MRRQLFTNAQALCRETRGRGIVVSSCARSAMELRRAARAARRRLGGCRCGEESEKTGCESSPWARSGSVPQLSPGMRGAARGASAPQRQPRGARPQSPPRAVLQRASRRDEHGNVVRPLTAAGAGCHQPQRGGCAPARCGTQGIPGRAHVPGKAEEGRGLSPRADRAVPSAGSAATARPVLQPLQPLQDWPCPASQMVEERPADAAAGGPGGPAEAGVGGGEAAKQQAQPQQQGQEQPAGRVQKFGQPGSQLGKRRR